MKEFSDNMLEQQICDFSQMRRDGTIEIKPVNAKRFDTLTFRSFTDSKTGITYGIPQGKNPQTGEYVFRRITIMGNRFYNLANKNDAMEWHVIKHHERLKGSPLQRGEPLIFVHDRTEEAAKSLQKIQDSRSALDIAMKLDGVELKDFARILAINPEANTMMVIKSLVAEKAMKDGAAFLKAYFNGNRGIEEVLKRAENAGLIKNKTGIGFMYNDTYPLGMTEAAVILTLSKQRDLLLSIDSESKMRLAVNDSSYNEKTEIYKTVDTSKVDMVQKPTARPAVKEDFATENVTEDNADILSQAAAAFGTEDDNSNDEWNDNLSAFDEQKENPVVDPVIPLKKKGGFQPGHNLNKKK